MTSTVTVAQFASPGEGFRVLLPDALAACGFRVQLVGQSIARDTYLDTEDWWLYRAGVTCRLRSMAGRCSLAVQPLSPAAVLPPEVSGLQEQLERPPAGYPGPMPGGKLAAWLAPLMRDAPVGPRLELKRRETRYRALSDGDTELECTVCVVQPLDGTPDQTCTELDLRLMQGDPGGLARVAKNVSRELGAKPTRDSALQRVAQQAGIRLPQLLEGEDLQLRKWDRFVDGAYRVLRRHFNRMLWNEPGTRLGVDPEYLHDMRVATRRMRSALRVFRDALPPRRLESLKRDLRWLGSALGEVRDLDVNLIHLQRQAIPDEPGAAPTMDRYVTQLRAHREKARRAMLRILDTRRYARFVERTRRFLEAGPPRRSRQAAAETPVVVAAAGIIRKRLKKVLRMGRAIEPGASDGQLHQLRIRCKRLRYACEFFADLYGRPAVRFAQRVTEVQGILGTHQDAIVARETLTQFAEDTCGPRAEVRRLCLALGQLIGQQKERAREARRQFFKAWKQFDRKKHRKPLQARIARFQRPTKDAPDKPAAGEDAR